MQTFLPYPDFEQTAKCLDWRRLGKQRVEAYQIYCCLTGRKTKQGKTYKGWKNHPAVKMWEGYERALATYMNCIIQEWKDRGYQNNMKKIRVKNPTMPPWLGNRSFHASHRSNLLRKHPEFYRLYKWEEPNDLPYIWPDKDES